ncbi:MULTISPECIES: TIGR02678 family protein [unclassified Streptomyces]|uniref:TIGR02678 family protein n=1 Tax=unclassified Streptomyces TaxID=2593676 RepID=UPI0022B602D5|nr:MULTISPECIES: TIGR02678 family protein [unclassified Streptomyces]MCZ7416351.1 TIGR02678 family protein [Streptomyces sp. WMMC897]MCZ7433839.1 TIGR02678 family protein [Streptomyces sp. WMMC1477]
MSTHLADVLEGQRAADVRRAARALLKEPLLTSEGPSADAFRLVRQHQAELREWFERNTGWSLRVDAEAARLRKTPGTLSDATHPAREARRTPLPFTRRRYVLLCLALAALERGEAQVALGRLAEQVVLAAADPRLSESGITFTLERREERSDLAAVVRVLLSLGVLRRVAGDEDAYVSGSGDALYDVRRRVLAGMTATSRGASLVTAEEFDDRLAELTAQSALESDELRFRAIRWKLTRCLLDDPVLYYETLSDEELAYLTRQRGFMTVRITELTGLVPEVRAEGIAMVDPLDDLTDVRMPEQGTHGHVTLLLAGHLAAADSAVRPAELEGRVRELAVEHGGFWSKTAREPGAEPELVEQALSKLVALGLVRRTPEGVVPLPALARYAVGEPEVREPGATRARRPSGSPRTSRRSADRSP